MPQPKFTIVDYRIDTPVMVNSQPKVHLTAISKALPINGKPEPVLSSIDLVANIGEFVSIIGPSGCGKSTLLNIIAGLDEADEGTVDLGEISPNDRLGNVGYMQQKDLLLPWRTVLDNAILGLELLGIHRKEAQKKAGTLIETFGLNGFEDQYPFRLSGGMRQRAAFLRTMLLDQELVLLDEPFGALDALTRAQMQRWLLKLWESWGKTILLITHDVDEAILLSDRIYVLTARPGRVKAAIKVDILRPRDLRAATHADFAGLRSHLMDLLQEEPKVGYAGS